MTRILSARAAQTGARRPRVDVRMKCGHVANSITPDGEPYCSYCLGEGVAALTPDEVLDENRKARCMDCGKLIESKPGKLHLAFFVYQDTEEYDKFWCRCKEVKR